ncbi:MULTISPECIES: outer membrane protein OmpK [Methylomonas]|uniref:outer membrane protein OmpK n=1 Tax=Methylomonas TaxID=416 RepID=UPI0012324D18|nr:outer membrane protein OmpK [Methylomonas rhizoryzae]
MFDPPRCARLASASILASFAITPCLADWMLWSVSEIQYLHGANYREPFNPNDVSRSLITVTHSHGWDFGRNFFFMDVMFSEAGEPSQTQLYGEEYSTLSMGKLTGLDLSYGIVKDFGLTGGINLGENLDAPYSGYRAWLYGVSVDLDIPGFDYFNIDFLRQRVTEPDDVGTSWQITPVWKFPFEIAGSRWSFEGFADFIGAKGNHQARQALAQPQLRLDVGDLFEHRNHLFIGLEYQYWHNKYGIKGLHESVPQALILWKF